MYNIANIDRKIELFSFDVYIAILKIKEVSNEFDNAENLLHDFRSWDSTIREFEIIGEAIKYLLKDNIIDKQYQEVVDFRNQITHEYFGIDQEIVWFIIHNELNDIYKMILKTIDSIDNNLKNEIIDSLIEENSYMDFIVTKLKELKI